MTLLNRYRLAKLRWLLPPHKFAALMRGHSVRHEVRIVLPIPFVGSLVIVRDIDARIEAS